MVFFNDTDNDTAGELIFPMAEGPNSSFSMDLILLLLLWFDVVLMSGLRGGDVRLCGGHEWRPSRRCRRRAREGSHYLREGSSLIFLFCLSLFLFFIYSIFLYVMWIILM